MDEERNTRESLDAGIAVAVHDAGNGAALRWLAREMMGVGNAIIDARTKTARRKLVAEGVLILSRMADVLAAETDEN